MARVRETTPGQGRRHVALYTTAFLAIFAGLKSLEVEAVDIQKHLTASGVDFYTINPHGNVPALILDDGTLLNEGAATLFAVANMVCCWQIACS